MKLAHLDLICRMITPAAGKSAIKALDDIFRRQAVNWTKVIELAHGYLVSPALWEGITTKGLGDLVEEELQRYLEKLQTMNAHRNTQLHQQASDAIGVLNSAGITPLLFKGASQLFHPLHNHIGSRIMTDLDIFILPDQVHAAYDALIRSGYEPADIDYDTEELHHLTPLVRPGSFGVVELHRRVLHNIYDSVLPSTDVWQAAIQVASEGIVFRLPCATHAVLIGFTHSKISDQCQFSLRALYDFVALASRSANKIDWEFIFAQLDTNHMGNAFRLYLLAAARMFGLPPGDKCTIGSIPRLHYAVYRTAHNFDPLHHLIDKAYQRLCAENICRRYNCSSNFIPLSAYRMQALLSVIKRRQTKAAHFILNSSSFTDTQHARKDRAVTD